MAVHIVSVPVSEEELARLNARARQAGLADASAYLREFVRHDVADPAAGAAKAERAYAIPDAPVSADMTFAEILAPIHAQIAASGMTDDEVDELFDQALKEVRAERRQQEQHEREQRASTRATADVV